MSSLPPSVSSVVLLDTDVWSLAIFPRRTFSVQGERWRRVLLGRDVVVAAQTEAELRFGALTAGWKAERLAALEAGLATTPTLPVTADVIRTVAEVRAACRRVGHPLGAKHHMGDAWIAATAIACRVPLLSGDGVFNNAPGLWLLAENTD